MICAKGDHQTKMEDQVDDTDNDKSIKRVEDFPDVSIFSSRLEYPALRIPARRTADLRRRLSRQLLRLPRMKNVYDDADEPDSYRLLVLANKDGLKDPQLNSLLEESNKGHEDSPAITITSHVIEMTYDMLTLDQILSKILKDKVQEIPSSFETVGHLAHVNLREDCLPFKYWIGKVILDKNKPRIRSVVNKLGTISNVYRTFGMEVIAGFQGDNWSIVTVREEKCKFQLDFQHVYWNSRLTGEHKRLVKLIASDAKHKQVISNGSVVVADVMAGVGPFAIPLTAHKNPRKIVVHANDLNPLSFKYLQINSTENQCRQLSAYNEDGRAFIHRLAKHVKDKEIEQISHFIMNLPASAPEILDAFRGYPIDCDDSHGDDCSSAYADLPWVHTHCFAPKAAEKDNFYQCVVDRCSAALGCQLDRTRDNIKIHVVRDVSPGQNMLCISFQLPRTVSTLTKIQLESDLEDEDHELQVAKRARTSSG